MTGPHKPGRVIVGVSRTLAGLQALRTAVAEARRRKAELVAVRTWRFNPSWREPEQSQWRRDIEAEAEQELRDAFLAALGRVPVDVNIRLLAMEGRTGQALTAYAYRDGDLLVVGAPTHRPFLRRGVAQYCRIHATCPVLVVPRAEMARAGRIRPLARRLRRETEQYVHGGT